MIFPLIQPWLSKQEQFLKIKFMDDQKWENVQQTLLFPCSLTLPSSPNHYHKNNRILLTKWGMWLFEGQSFQSFPLRAGMISKLWDICLAGENLNPAAQLEQTLISGAQESTRMRGQVRCLPCMESVNSVGWSANPGSIPKLQKLLLNSVRCGQLPISTI